MTLDFIEIMLAVSGVAGLCGSFYLLGFKNGEDRGWLDRQEQLWKEEKARRDAAGRFRSTKLIIRQL